MRFRTNTASSETEHGVGEPLPLLTDARAGTRLGAYELDTVIGRGGMGVVYRARHVHLDRVVALKLLSPEASSDDVFRARFLRESRAAASLHHPAVVTVYDAGEVDGLLYIAMQHVGGSDLRAVVREQGPLDPRRALYLLGQVADGLAAAHARGLVHRDVKPANILVDGDRCYLTDFGLTRHMASASAMTTHGQFLGTVEYMAPEQIDGGVVDQRVDVYALGCVLYETLAGASPFQRESQVSVIYAHLHHPPPSLRNARPDLPPELDHVIARALAKSKDERYTTCVELIDAARVAVDENAPAPAPPPVAAPPPARRDVVAVLVDDPPLRAMAMATLARAGRRVYDSPGAASAARAAGDRVAVVVADTAGREAARAAGLGDAPTLAVAARGESLADASRVDAVLVRPFSSLQLLMTADDVAAATAVAAPPSQQPTTTNEGVS